MSKNIIWYIRRFFEELNHKGIKSTFHKIYNYRATPNAQRISFLRQLSYFPPYARSQALDFIGDSLEFSCSLKGGYNILFGEKSNFASCDVVLIAHKDKDNIVDEYVLYMAQQFKKIGKKIIICSAAPLEKLPPHHDIDAIISRKYLNNNDFVSWKIAFEAFPSLYDAKEITLCNDSFFAPIGSYTPVYQSMDSINCDFWGMTYSVKTVPYMDRYHIVLKEKALKHQALKKFISAITPNQSENFYEERFSLWVELCGLQPACYRPYNMNLKSSISPIKKLRDGIPLLSRDIFEAQGRIVALPSWQFEIEKDNYPSQLISNYFNRIGIEISSVLCPGKRHATWPPSVFTRYKDLTLSQHAPSQHRLQAAAIIHCYYPDLFSGLLKYIKNIPLSTHIYISTDTEEKRTAIQRQIDSIGFSKVEIRICPNKGWDIAPFLAGFTDIISRYDLLCKVHAKASPHISKNLSKNWCSMLYESLIGSTQQVQKIFQLFENTPSLGMIIPPSLPYYTVDMGANRPVFLPLAQKMGIQIPQNEAIDFPVGSMFWARSAALQPLLDLQLSFDDFDDTDPKQRDGTLAHAIERSFVLSCCKAGYSWGRLLPSTIV